MSSELEIRSTSKIMKAGTCWALPFFMVSAVHLDLSALSGDRYAHLTAGCFRQAEKTFLSIAHVPRSMQSSMGSPPTDLVVIVASDAINAISI